MIAFRMFQRAIRCPILFFDMYFDHDYLDLFTRDIALMDTELAENISDVLEVNR